MVLFADLALHHLYPSHITLAPTHDVEVLLLQHALAHVVLHLDRRLRLTTRHSPHRLQRPRLQLHATPLARAALALIARLEAVHAVALLQRLQRDATTALLLTLLLCPSHTPLTPT